MNFTRLTSHSEAPTTILFTLCEWMMKFKSKKVIIETSSDKNDHYVVKMELLDELLKLVKSHCATNL